ncbi:MAG: SH3 domain-containing protein [Campylobacteraceae bacterium]|jgi:hypothetical protein|nr:SH3 domain-containing protein [Campylobacteraceae bacterium]
MRFFIYFCIIFFIFTGCSFKEAGSPFVILQYEQKADILPDAPMLSQDEIKNFKNNFLEKYFAAWDTNSLWANKKDASFGFQFLKNKNRYVAENRIEVDDDWVENIENLSNFDEYGSVLEHAITTKNTNLRLLPTDKPLFKASNKSFDYPFDTIQNSFINIMQPITISHYSTDFAWAFVESSIASGWIKSNELAIVDKETIRKIKTAPKIVITKDNAPIYYKEGLFAHYLKAGSVLPAYKYENGRYSAFIVDTQKDGNGFIADVIISKEFARPFPLRFDSFNVKKIINELLNENYGWGGLYNNRDCSALTKDFFSIFGIWLPRNSRAQKNAALYFDISKLTAAQKEEKLRELAQPYLTLIYMPGHIMLYVGEDEGRALVMHNIWGLTNSKGEKFLIGKSIISDLYIGENLPDMEKKNLLMNKIQGFTVFAPKSALAKVKLIKTYQDTIEKIADNIVYFKDGSEIVFDDKKQKSYEQILENPDILDQFYEPYIKGVLNDTNRNDAGRIRNEEFFKAMYGQNKQKIEQNLIEVSWLPSTINKTYPFNKNNGAAKALQAVSNELDNLDETYLEFLQYPSGTYNYRNIADTSRLSMHAFGIAIDLDVKYANYWLWDIKTKKTYENHLPQEIVDIFEKHGFIWGGKWLHYDTMHFEYRPELL